MTKKATPPQRIIGLDSHPDTFTAALLRGHTPAAAVIEKMFNQVPISQLSRWAQKHTPAGDLFVLEASGNSFQVVRTLAAIGREALVLESAHLGKLKEAHANNDKISAVRIGKAYLAGTAKPVWVPDAKTQERRDWFHIHRKVVKRTTQMRNRLRSYLSDHGVRLKKGLALAKDRVVVEQLRQAKDWSPRQWQVIEGMLLELRHADEQRAHWRSLIAFALGAIIGDIHRFAEPRKLVKYFGLNPAFDHSGAGQWSGGIAGHGRKDIRSLLIEAAQAILRAKDPLTRWGKKLLARKGSLNLAVAAVARKLTVAVWYCLMGRQTTLQEVDARLTQKIGKIITGVGASQLKKLHKNRKAFREEVFHTLKTGRSYVLNPAKTAALLG